MLQKKKSFTQSILATILKLVTVAIILFVANTGILIINPTMSYADATSESELIDVVAETEGTDAEVDKKETETSEPIVSEVVDENTKLLKKLETDIIPQISSVLTPEQQESFANNIAAGASLRKAFKAITLTPAQKNKLSTIFKSVPKNDMFATLTPAQKKQLFMQKKQIFMPTAEEIGEKINAGMAAKDKVRSPLAPSTDEIVEKINAKMKLKDSVLNQIETSGK